MVTAAQLRDVVERLIVAGHWRQGDPPIEIVMDSGYDVTRLAFVLADLPVVVTGRLRSDRVMIGPIPARLPGTMGRPPRHGPVLELAQPNSWHTPDHATTTSTTRYGTAVASAWARMHPRLTRRGAWLDHPQDQDLPIVEGTVIRLQVDHLPGDPHPETAVAVDLPPERRRRSDRRHLAGVPAPVRPRAHLTVLQATARLDHPEAT